MTVMIDRGVRGVDSHIRKAEAMRRVDRRSPSAKASDMWMNLMLDRPKMTEAMRMREPGRRKSLSIVNRE